MKLKKRETNRICRCLATCLPALLLLLAAMPLHAEEFPVNPRWSAYGREMLPCLRP